MLTAVAVVGVNGSTYDEWDRLFDAYPTTVKKIVRGTTSPTFLTTPTETTTTTTTTTSTTTTTTATTFTKEGIASAVITSDVEMTMGLPNEHDTKSSSADDFENGSQVFNLLQIYSYIYHDINRCCWRSKRNPHVIMSLMLSLVLEGCEGEYNDKIKPTGLWANNFEL